MKKLWFGAAGLLALGAVAAIAQTVVVPQVYSINANDLFQDIVNGQPRAGNQYASAALLQSYFGNNQPSRGNAIIGGDATTNLWQRGTAGAQTTSTTPSYNGPDRFAQWATSSAGVTLSRDSTAGDLPTGYKYAFKLAHTNTTAGTICAAQEVESVNSYQFAGAIAELDFHAVTGAGFTGTSGGMTASIVTGTGQDEGVASLEAGTWTGQANATAAVINLGVGTSGRYAAIASIPTGTTEVAVTLCYTTTTADTNDYIALSGIQLIRSTANAAFVNAAAGYNTASTPGLLAASFERRTQADEAQFQQRYYYQLTDSGANTVRYAMGQATTTAAAVFVVPFPVTMRAAPTATASATTAFGDTATAGTATACTAFAVVASATSPQSGAVTCTTGATMTQGGASQLVGEATSANVNFSAEL